jgi:hypothetical protein
MVVVGEASASEVPMHEDFLIFVGLFGVIFAFHIVRAVFFRKPAGAGGGTETVGWGLPGVAFGVAPCETRSDPWPSGSLASQAFDAAQTPPGPMSLSLAQPGSLPWIIHRFEDHHRT